MWKILLLSFLPLISCEPSHSTLTSNMLNYPANEISSGKIVFTKINKNDKITIISTNKNKKSIMKILSKSNSPKEEILYFKSTKNSGTVTIHTSNNLKLKLNFYLTQSDTDNDGFPDNAELNNESDRRSFRLWFVRIADSQFLKRDNSWNGQERDCSGLIRYSYREALKKHNELWNKRTGIIIDKNLSDIKSFNYPKVPILGKNIFQVSASTKQKVHKVSFEKNRNYYFSIFADAESLLKYNTSFVSRNISDALMGDLLFFVRKKDGKNIYHSMIVSQNELDKIIIIYHTGDNNNLKRIKSDYLKNSLIFNPISENKNFLGVYRFKILN